jgi:biotin carboxyl carrier protein
LQYEIEVGGRTRQVVVTRTGDTFAVAMDSRTWLVDVARIDAHTLSLIVDSDTRIGAVHDVTVAPHALTGQLTVHVSGTPVPVTVNGRRRWGRKDEGAGGGDGPQRVTAPMPGKIVRVLVNAGDAVKARQALVVVEAMKMENELRAARDGTIAEVHAREGASVDAGALLIVIQ